MEMNRLVGHIFIGFMVWLALIIYGRLKEPLYNNLCIELAGKKEITGGEEAFLYYYTCITNYLKGAFASALVLAFFYYLPVILPYLGVNNIDEGSTLIAVRKYIQLFTIILTFFGLLAYHRCHYQLETVFKHYISEEPVNQAN